ncbi:MAG TPA: hypothetical protein IGS37_01290 [Synechococcales cyanobacterium M55_K2018_004]|nr:hypothetical protein [Synechococcales cyanobacterium M55_K2018_004]
MTSSPTDRLDRIERMLEALATNQIEERERRLAFREDLELLYQRQQQTQVQLDALSERQDRTQAQLDALSERQDRTQAQLDALSERQDRTQAQLDALSERQDRTQAQLDALSEQLSTRQEYSQLLIDALSAQVNAYIVQSNAFLAAEALAREEFRKQMTGLQTEVRNILAELAEMRRQRENGNP